MHDIGWGFVLAAAGLMTLVSLTQAYSRCAPATTDDGHERLSDTGLYADITTGKIASDVRAFAPRFELWTDGAAKHRWVWLPRATRIDTSDPDDWRFPVGTKLWKAFIVDGKTIETRFLERVGPGDADWRALSYVWDEGGTEAFAAPAGQDNAGGTDHDVPAAADCAGCHGGRASFVLGFSAVQLALPPRFGQVTLASLAKEKRLTDISNTHLAVPGDANTVAALGLLHANCSHCHNQRRPASAPTCFDPQHDFDLGLWVSDLSHEQETATYRTAFGRIFEAGNGEGSKAVRRFGRASPFRPAMPPIGTERINAEGRKVLVAWLNSLAHRRP